MDYEDDQPVALQQLFAGGLRELENDGSLTGLYKRPVEGCMTVHETGLAGDKQADRKNHGGPERALSHYPAEHYAHWRHLFPRHADAFNPGVFGENLSTDGLTEDDVCIGDIYRLGDALIQISQPRMPCWKISRRLALPDLAKKVASTGRSGWLFRVRQVGEIAAGQSLKLEHRPSHGVTLTMLWLLRNASEPDLEQLEAYAVLPELADSWRKAFASRLAYLKKK